VDATVVEAAGQHLADRTQRDALRLSNSGDLAGAHRVLHHSHALLADYALSAPALATEVDEIDSLAQQIAERPLPSHLSKERYLQAQLRSSGKRDLRGSADDRLAPAERAQQLLAGYIKSSVAWPQTVPDPLSDSQAEVVRDRVRGCLLWGAVGDALGRPLQGVTPSEIQARYGQAGLTRYLPPREWRSGPTGVYTSDTALAVELARSLVAGAGRLDPEEFAQRLVRQGASLRAAGSTTASAIGQMAYGAPWWEAAHPQSAGCAAAVRSAPVGLVHALAATPLELRQQAVLAALPTHRTGAAVAGAVALAAGVAWLVREVARGAEQVDAAAFAGFVADAVAGIEPPASGNAPQLTQRLRTLAAAPAHATPEQAFAGLGHSTRAVDAVPAAFFYFLRSPDDPRQVVSAAAKGGHSATAVASMAGQLAGAWSGAERLARLAAAWWDELEGRDDLRNLADQLATLALRPRGR
jgi:ADP-ribosylglycohydrolase